MVDQVLALSKELALPLRGIATQKMAALGISGSGKTYGIGKLVELMLDAGVQVVVIDTVGNWSGLRLAADGKKPGIAIPILGGEMGDIPLEHTQGKLVAETVVGTRSSLIADVSDFTGGELQRFVVDFATTLLALKKRQKSPVMIVWEECQDIVPQVVKGDVARMVGAVQKLIKKGRNYGVGTILISQRAAAVNKEALNQTSTLLCFRQVARHDRDAIKDWIVHKSLDAKELERDLPTLPTGTCFCWSPEWLGVMKKIRVLPKRTFDASATPEHGQEIDAGELVPIDLEQFKQSMGAAIAAAEANDPERLRARIAELEEGLVACAAEELTDLRVERDRLLDELERLKTDLAQARATPALSEATVERLETAARSLHETGIAAVEASRDVIAAIPGAGLGPAYDREAVRAFGQRIPILNSAAEIEAHLERTRPTERAPTKVPEPTTRVGAGAGLTKCARSILTALVQHGALSLTQAAIIAGYASDSGGVRNAAGELRSAAYAEGANARLVATPAGKAALGEVPRLPTGRRLLEYWLAKLDKAPREVLRIVAREYPRAVSLKKAAEEAGYAPDSGGVRNAAGHLRTLNLVHGSNAGMVADERLVR